MERLQNTAIVNEDISSPVLVATYTALEDAELFAQVYLEGLAGGGTYKACLTKQIGGAGTAYQSPTAGIGVYAGETTVYVGTIAVPVQEDDVIKVYVEGLAGDVNVDGAVEIFDGAVSDELVDDIWDELLAGHTIVGSSGYTLSQALVKTLTALSALQNYSVLRKKIKCDQIEIKRSTDVSFELFGVGDISGRTSLYFTVKLMKDKDAATDAQSIIQIEETAGLLYINKAEADIPANGSITVTDAVAGTMTIALDAEEADKLLPNEQYLYDIKMDNTVMVEGRFLISTAITRTIT